MTWRHISIILLLLFSGLFLAFALSHDGVRSAMMQSAGKVIVSQHHQDKESTTTVGGKRGTVFGEQ